MGFRILCTLLIAAFCTGCPIADELDAANLEMERYSSNREDKKKKANKGGKPAKRDYLSTLQASWKDATNLEEGYEDTGIVHCNLAGQIQFMKREDCLSQGGRLASGSR
jgi:hypothetical protein